VLHRDLILCVQISRRPEVPKSPLPTGAVVSQTASAGRHVILTNFDVPQDYKTRLEAPRWNHEVVRVKRDVGPSGVDLEKVDVIVMGGDYAVREMLGFDPSEAKNLRLFQTVSAGVDQFDMSVIPRGVIICSNVGGLAEPMAESVFAFILAFAKNLPSLQEDLRRGDFPRWTKPGMSLKGETLGVIGAGGIGRATARLAKAFGMRVLGIASRARSIENFDFVGTLDDLDYLLRESDVVVVSIPRKLRTRGLINREKLNEMKRNAILVNVARGPIIVEKDLYEHLKENPEFRAGIDVWWKYPKKGEKFQPDYPFTSLNNVLVMPHSSWSVPGINQEVIGSALENVLRFLAGDELKGVVDRSDYGF
jgi:phosphoglycerate dehydrogenase-like enzyme